MPADAGNVATYAIEKELAMADYLDIHAHALTARDVADMLGVSQNFVYKLAKEGKIPSYRVGRKLRFASDDIASYMGRGRHAAEPAAMIDAKSDSAYVSRITTSPRQGSFRIMGMGHAADAIASYLDGFGIGVSREYRTGYASLIALYMGQVDAAITCLWDRATDTCNLPYIQRLAPGMPCVVMTLGRQSYGFVVKKGNPKEIRDWPDLLKDGVILGNRDPGSTPRILLDEHLIAMEAIPEHLIGYQHPLHSELSLGGFVSRDVGDVGIGTEQLFHMIGGLDYLPLQEVEITLVIRKAAETKRVIPLLRQIVQSDDFRYRLDAIPGMQSIGAGQIIYEV